MCTCIDLKTKDYYFGRNLDLEYRFNEKVVITPRNYELDLKKGPTIKNKYAMIGMAAVVDNYPLYAEASNEKGLCIAGLDFKNNAYYTDVKIGKINITPYELIPWVLGNFANINELKNIITNINLINIPFSKDMNLTPLHWMISDEKGCLVIEQTKEGLNVYSNPIRVLTNNPPFPYHLENIKNYINLTPGIAENRFSDKIELKPYSNGMGAIGLPGDSSSASRFIRAAFNKLNSATEYNEEASVSQFFHILDSVAVIKGTTKTTNNKYNITNYSSCINASKGIYYYKTYDNSQITAVQMTEKNINSDKLSIYELIEKQQIKYLN